MACLGVHFAIPQDVVQELIAFRDDEALVNFIQEELEEEYFKSQRDYLCETGKAWDAIHRCLTDGKLLFENGEYPLNLCILGGKQLHSGDNYIISLVGPEDVPKVAEALQSVTKDQFRKKYDQIEPDDYGVDLSDDDFGYTWEWFESLKPFWSKAAKDGRAVLFTVDQ